MLCQTQIQMVKDWMIFQMVMLMTKEGVREKRMVFLAGNALASAAGCVQVSFYIGVALTARFQVREQIESMYAHHCEEPRNTLL